MEYTFKNCESLYCAPVTYIILYVNYTSKKKVKSWLPGAGGVGVWGRVVYGYRVSVLQDEKVLEICFTTKLKTTELYA